MKKLKFNWKEILLRKENLFLIPSIVWIFVVTLLNYYGSANIINSDMSAELVLGNELAKTHRIFTTQWYYSTEVRIFYTQIVSMILFMFISSWKLVRTITNLIFMIGLLAAYLFAMRPLQMKRCAEYLSSLFLFIPFSMEYLGIVHIGNSYMPHFIVVFVGIGLWLRLMKKFKVAWLVIFLVLCFYAGLCGIRYLTILAFPMILAAVLKSVLKNQWDDIKVPAMGAIACMIGAVVNLKIFPMFISVGGNNSLQISDLAGNGFIGGIDYLLVSILRLFGYRDLEPLGSANGLASIAAIVMMVVFFIVIFTLVGRYSKLNGEKQTVLLMFLMSMFTNTFIFMFVAGTFVPRFYMPTLILLAPCVAMYMDEKEVVNQMFHRFVIAFLIIAMNISGFAASTFCVTTTMNDPFKKVVGYLEEEGLTFGVTTFWNTGVINELSNGKIECVNVKDENLQELYGWLTFKKYQNPQMWNNLTCDWIFVLLDCGMYEEHQNSEMIQDGELVYDDAGYVVLVYNKNQFVEKYSGFYCK